MLLKTPAIELGRLACAAIALAGLLFSAACATTRAETVSERPALEVPPPPPRVITAPPPTPVAPLPEPVSELPGSSAQPPVRPRPPRDRDTAKPDTAKPEEPKPVEPASPVPVAPPVPQLRIPETGDTARLSAQIREIIDRTRRALKTVNYGPLSDPRKKAYDDAVLFANQAEEAIKANNLVYAKELADKAERLAKELQG